MQMSLHKVCMLSVMRRDSNTSCLDQYWITIKMGMPYWWWIKMWLYVVEFETQNHKRLAIVCPMEVWDNNMVENIRPK